MHKLLARQLRRHFESADRVPAELQPFLAAIERAYEDADQERSVLEHSMQTVSRELEDRFRRLQAALHESQRAQDELDRAVSLLSATLESTADGILVVDRKGKIVQMNQRFVELWRIPEAVIESRDDARALDYVLEQLANPTTFLHKVRELYGQPEAESFDVVPFKDGRTFERYSMPQRIGDEIVGRVWSFRDVTVRRQLEEQLRQSQKLEAVGSLAGGVAHDFNNILTVIRGHAGLLADTLSPDDTGQLDLREISRAAERAAALTRQLLAFSRKQVLQPTALDLNDVVTALMSMLRRLIGEHIQIAFEPAPALGIVTADPTQMEQVIVNLVLNARDAMPAGGRVRITTENLVLDADGDRERVPDLPTGPCVVLTVSDSGHGVAPEHRERIFEPFFSTKEVGKGTGLGLSTVFGIVKQSGGHITLESEVGRGASFRIYLPMSGPSSKQNTPVSLSAAALPGVETILLTEDDDTVRVLVQRVLEARGYTVLPAHDAAEALRLYESHAREIGLLLTDVVMPGMSGVDLAAEIQRRNPGIRTLYMTGYAAEDIDKHGLLARGAPLLRKPFTGPGLELAVRAVLDTGGLAPVS
ncbi:MAG: ATP-binding protein [Gemmatimonadaceae bacterium]